MSVDTLLVCPPPASDLPDPAPTDWQSPPLSPVQLVPITSLHPPVNSPRVEGESAEHAQQLAESGGVLPPITVHRASRRVVDGMHRLRAAQLRGETVIPVRFFEGTAADAFVLGVESNARHGRPLSTADRTAATARILVSHPQWSDRAIAAVAGLSAKAVAAIRRSAGDGIPAATARVGRDGRVRPVDPAAGRLRAGELIARNPDASLRDIAKAAGISPGTVRDVRDRLRRGEGPVPVRQQPAPDADTAPAERRPESHTPRCEPPVAVEPERLLEALSKDPTLRYTDGGRQLLRLLAAHLTPAHRQDELARSVPEHWAGAVSAAARQCAAAWASLADTLDARPLCD